MAGVPSCQTAQLLLTPAKRCVIDWVLRDGSRPDQPDCRTDCRKATDRRPRFSSRLGLHFRHLSKRNGGACRSVHGCPSPRPVRPHRVWPGRHDFVGAGGVALHRLVVCFRGHDCPWGCSRLTATTEPISGSPWTSCGHGRRAPADDQIPAPLGNFSGSSMALRCPGDLTILGSIRNAGFPRQAGVASMEGKVSIRHVAQPACVPSADSCRSRDGWMEC